MMRRYKAKHIESRQDKSNSHEVVNSYVTDTSAITNTLSATRRSQVSAQNFSKCLMVSKATQSIMSDLEDVYCR